MQEEQPIAHAIASSHCNEDNTSYQSPSKRKTRQSQSKQGNSSAQAPSSARYTRSQAAPDWSMQEVLILLSEIVAIDEVWLKELSSYQRWKMISDSCMAMNVVRSSNQCKRKWEMLLDDYKKIVKLEPQSREDSYWLLPEDKRKEYGLPVSFQKEVFDAMDAVIQVQQHQSDSNNSDPEQLITVPELETYKMNADSGISMLYLPSSAHEGEELVTTSKILEVEELILKRPEKAIVLAGDKLAITSKSLEVEEPIIESSEKSLVLTGDDSITASKSPEVRGVIKTSKSSEERPEVEVLNTTSTNLDVRPEVEELFTTSNWPEMEERTSKSSEERLKVEVPNKASKSLKERPEVEELIKTSKIPEVEDFITSSKCPEVEALITTSKIPEKALVMAASEKEEMITASKSSEGGELISPSKSSEMDGVITVYEQEELIPSSNSSDKARLMARKLHDNAEHVCAILSGELQDGASHSPSPTDPWKRSAEETEFARRQADELIKTLAELTASLDELSDHIRRCGCSGILPVGSMA